jgi:hypothetical protein
LLVRPEINIRPWQEEFPDIKQGSQVVNWKNKKPLAYWKGNPDVLSPVRTELLNCNDSRQWGAEIMRQVLLNHLSQFQHKSIFVISIILLCTKL